MIAGSRLSFCIVKLFPFRQETLLRYSTPILNSELTEAIITDIGKIRQLRALMFIPFFKGLLDYGIDYPLKLQRVTLTH